MKLVTILYNFILKLRYPIKDVIWPSRRWDNNNEYIDLSG